MNTLVIGGGGREYAIALALSKSKNTSKLIVAPGNPGISHIANCQNININSAENVIKLCKDNAIQFVVIGPEQPIAAGLTDKLTAENITVFAPTQFAAQLESSKSFAKHFMAQHNIPTAKYAVFTKDSTKSATDYINAMSTPIVIKADGLAAGKGVVIAQSKSEAIDTIDTFFKGSLGAASETIVIEEFMQGEEMSVFAICDGKDYVLLPPSQDHKRIGENDTGANTGGMGAYSPVSLANAELMAKIKTLIIEPTLAGMAQAGHPYIGCLYVGLMIYENNPKVVEFNVRFGDPETQAVLSIFCGDFLELLHSAAIGQINKSAFDEKSTLKQTACCVILASQGYPGKYDTGKPITGLEKAGEIATHIYHSGTKSTDAGLVTAGGRVLGVTSVADNIHTATEITYKAIDKIHFDGMYYRPDIAMREKKRLK